MEHDLNAYRSGLLQSKLYVGSPGFLPAVCWEQGKNGNVLSDKASKTDAVMSIVGRALESRLNCEPHGNFNRKYGSLEGAKFQLQLVKTCRHTGQAASTQDRRNFIVTEAGNKNFRFGEHIFEKRATPLDLDGGEVRRSKSTTRAVPLSVFKGDAFVPPEQVTDVVKGALVEVHFELYHYHIRNKGYDSFNGSIEQIIVLQPGEIQHMSAYKRKNVEEGPIRLKPSLVLQTGTRSISNAGNAQSKTSTVEQGVQPEPGPSTRVVVRAQSEVHVQPNQSGLSQGLPGISENEEPLKEAHGNDVETVKGEAVKGKGKEVSK
ncbi:hypothetical protein EDB85DRAFT_2159061 [Lactarius pseudohatsudake]|nr:hypothetical protein EDB85DRAFT_2159061 [Lactarius pseudohatsudake]